MFRLLNRRKLKINFNIIRLLESNEFSFKLPLKTLNIELLVVETSLLFTAGADLKELLIKNRKRILNKQ